MPVNILGISAYYHDSAGCLVTDGRIRAAAQEERFTRIKHDFSFPSHAAAWCLESAGLKVSDIDFVAFYDKPFIKFERILESYIAFAPAGIRSFLQAMPLWLRQKLFLGETLRKELSYEGKIIFPEHHESHTASAFYPSPYRARRPYSLRMVWASGLLLLSVWAGIMILLFSPSSRPGRKPITGRRR